MHVDGLTELPAARNKPPRFMWSCLACSAEPFWAPPGGPPHATAISAGAMSSVSQRHLSPILNPARFAILPRVQSKSAIHDPGLNARGAPRPVAICPGLPAPLAGDLGGNSDVSQHLLPSGGQPGPARSSQRPWQTRTEQYHGKHQGLMDLPLGSTPQGRANPLKLRGMVGPNIYAVFHRCLCVRDFSEPLSYCDACG